MTYARFADCNDCIAPRAPLEVTVLPILEADPASLLNGVGPQSDSRHADPEGQQTISTKVVPCGVPPLKSLFPSVGDSLLHFQLISELGAGAFSRVFLASQQDLAGRFGYTRFTIISSSRSCACRTSARTLLPRS